VLIEERDAAKSLGVNFPQALLAGIEIVEQGQLRRTWFH